jgi:hypothetical protein
LWWRWRWRYRPRTARSNIERLRFPRQRALALGTRQDPMAMAMSCHVATPDPRKFRGRKHRPGPDAVCPNVPSPSPSPSGSQLPKPPKPPPPPVSGVYSVRQRLLAPAHSSTRECWICVWCFCRPLALFSALALAHSTSSVAGPLPVFSCSRSRPFRLCSTHWVWRLWLRPPTPGLVGSPH